MLPQATSSLYLRQQERIAEAIAGSRAEWSRISSPAQFGRIANRLFALLAAAQLGAARDGAAMVPAALAQTGFPEKPIGTVRPAGFVGWSSQGFRLDSLLWMAPSIAEQQAGPLVQKMAAGQLFLDLVMKQQISDAGRMASGATITATPNTGWVRYVSPPCCQDCAILAGRWYRYSSGFQRHRGCDCQHRPASVNEAPAGYAEQVSLDQIHDLTDAQRKAIEDGADMNQVVNAYRRSTRSRRDRMLTTDEGTTRRGWASQLRRATDRERGVRTAETVTRTRTGQRNVTRVGRRLTPEAIYTADIPREEAVRLLIENGYMVGDLRTMSRLIA